MKEEFGATESKIAKVYKDDKRLIDLPQSHGFHGGTQGPSQSAPASLFSLIEHPPLSTLTKPHRMSFYLQNI